MFISESEKTTVKEKSSKQLYKPSSKLAELAETFKSFKQTAPEKEPEERPVCLSICFIIFLSVKVSIEILSCNLFFWKEKIILTVMIPSIFLPVFLIALHTLK